MFFSTLIGAVIFMITPTTGMTAYHAVVNTGLEMGTYESQDIATVNVEYAPEQTFRTACRELVEGKEYTLYTSKNDVEYKIPIHVLMRADLFHLTKGMNGKGYFIKEKLWKGSSGSPVLDTDGKVVALVHGWSGGDNFIISPICIG